MARATAEPVRRVLTSPTVEGDRRRLDGGLFDPWDDPLPDWVNTDPLPPFPPEPPEPPGGGGGGIRHAAVRIELYAPAIAQPVQTWDLPEAIDIPVRIVTFNPPGFPAPDAPVNRVGWWQVVVTPTGGEPAMMHVEAHAFLTRVPFRTRAITTRLFDHLFRVVLEALVPHAVIEGSTLKVGIGEEIARELGISQVLTETDISPIVSQAKLRSLNITAVSGRRLKQIATGQKHKPPRLSRVQDTDIAIRIQAAFDNASATAYGLDVGRLNGEFGQLFLSFNRNLTELSPAAFLDVDFSTLADWLISLASLFTEIDHDIVNKKTEDGVISHERPIRTYLREVLSRAVGQRAVVHEVWFGAGAWQILYFDDPLMPDPDAPWRPWVDDVAGEVGGVGGAIASVPLVPFEVPAGTETPSGGAPSEPTSTAPAGEPLGVFPAGFVVEDGPALERLDRHQSLVVIMMENRSYDHMLGGLTAARPRPSGGYDGPASNASNAPVGGFLERVPIVNVDRIAMGTAIPTEPRHSYKPVRFQIGDGSGKEEGLGTGDMNGFARDLYNRSDSPQFAMTMYGERHLPVYYRLADEFCVCDRWFCAHPGPTWPNRFATLMGRIPQLDNFKIDDPIIGFIKDQSIFDTMTGYGIEWRVFESDLSLVRMFDRYRLDDRRVVPIDDPVDGLDATLRSPGPLPRVMFVEPNFSDLPPVATANDDHPPGDLAAGQAFIARVCDAIWSAGRFGECLVCITYDEHGGFYDHVPPPGTAKGDPAMVGQIPKLHPDGPSYLGVRVPTFILSPYVSAGKADHTIYDHTSILKTILVHNRAVLPGSVMGSYGERVNRAAHLGQALDLSSARQPPLPFDPMRRRPLTPGGSIHDIVPGGVLETATLGTTSGPPPIPPRTVTIMPRTAPLPEEVDEPDFHAALRGALKPRR